MAASGRETRAARQRDKVDAGRLHGHGRSGAGLSGAEREEVRIVGADFCRPMLAVGHRKCLHAGAAGRVALLEADALRLPFGDDRFDIVCVAFGLRNLSDTDAGLREMVRVCRPAGQVAVLEFSTPGCRPLGAVTAGISAECCRGWDRC